MKSFNQNSFSITNGAMTTTTTQATNQIQIAATSALRIYFVAFALTMIALSADASERKSWDRPFPRPGPVTSEDNEEFSRARLNPSLKTDTDCGMGEQEIRSTEFPVSTDDQNACRGRNKEIVFLSSTQGIYLCESGRIVRNMRTSIGSDGLGKWMEGDRRTPLGSFWLGLPRASRFGIFIPVGYPNAEDVRVGRGGGDIGLHGPLRIEAEAEEDRASACSVIHNITRNWTAGCIAVARDTQILEIADWVIAHWPVKLHVIDDARRAGPRPTRRAPVPAGPQ